MANEGHIFGKYDKWDANALKGLQKEKEKPKSTIDLKMSGDGKKKEPAAVFGDASKKGIFGGGGEIGAGIKPKTDAPTDDKDKEKPKNLFGGALGGGALGGGALGGVGGALGGVNPPPLGGGGGGLFGQKAVAVPAAGPGLVAAAPTVVLGAAPVPYTGKKFEHINKNLFEFYHPDEVFDQKTNQPTKWGAFLLHKDGKIIPNPIFAESSMYGFILNASAQIKEGLKKIKEEDEKQRNSNNSEHTNIREIKSLKGRVESLVTKINVMQTKTLDFRNCCDSLSRDIKNCNALLKRKQDSRNRGNQTINTHPLVEMFENEIEEIERKILQSNRRVEFLGDLLGISQREDGSAMDSSSLSSYQANSRNAAPGQEEIMHLVDVEKEAYKNLMHIVEDIDHTTNDIKRKFLQDWKTHNGRGEPPSFDDEVKEKKKIAQEKAQFKQQHPTTEKVGVKAPASVGFAATKTTLGGGVGAGGGGGGLAVAANPFGAGLGGGISNPFGPKATTTQDTTAAAATTTAAAKTDDKGAAQEKPAAAPFGAFFVKPK